MVLFGQIFVGSIVLVIVLIAGAAALACVKDAGTTCGPR